MFDDFVIWYLFLGGIGGGSYLAWYVLRHLFEHKGDIWKRGLSHITIPVLTTALLSLAAGSLCLLADLTNPSKAHLLFLKPSISIIAVGAFALLLLAVALVLIIGLSVWRQASSWMGLSCVKVLEISTAVLSLTVTAYTGVLLYSMSSVPLWRTFWVPVLFVLSSGSAGLAVVTLVGVIMLWDSPKLATMFRTPLRIDSILILFEMLAMFFAFWKLNDTELAAVSLGKLMTGELSLIFWVGVVGLGMVVPMVLEVASLAKPPRNLLTYVIIGFCVLAGSFSLRYCIVNAGMHISQFMFVGL